MTPFTFVESLSAVRLNSETVFNPYSDHCQVHDLPNAPELRRKNLVSALEAAAALGVDSVWVGQEPGHKGARRTGLALTDDMTLPGMSEMLGVPLEKATRTSVRENTAQTVWKILPQLDRIIFPWNAFPLHSHRPGEPLSNRDWHDSEERALGEEFLRGILGMLNPRRVVAIGRDAEGELRRMGIPAAFACHPAYPFWRKEFFRQAGEIYGVKFTDDGRKEISL